MKQPRQSEVSEMISVVDTHNGRNKLFISSGNLTYVADVEIEPGFPGYARFSIVGSSEGLCIEPNEWVEFKEMIRAVDDFMMKRVKAIHETKST